MPDSIYLKSKAGKVYITDFLTDLSSRNMWLILHGKPKFG